LRHPSCSVTPLLCSDALLPPSQRIGFEIAGVGSLHQNYARVGAELHGDLTEAGVDGRDMRGAVLEETVGESAGRSADVKAGAIVDVDAPVVEGVGELEASTADVGLVFAKEADGGVRGDGCTGLIDFLPCYEDTAGENEGAGALAAGDKGTIR